MRIIICDNKMMMKPMITKMLQTMTFNRLTTPQNDKTRTFIWNQMHEKHA